MLRCGVFGLRWPILGLCCGHVDPSWRYVGAMLAHLGAMLQLCCPILPLCRAILADMLPLREPPRGDLGLCFNRFTFIPKILLEKAPATARSIFATPSPSKTRILPGTGTPESSHQWKLGAVLHPYLLPAVGGFCLRQGQGRTTSAISADPARFNQATACSRRPQGICAAVCGKRSLQPCQLQMSGSKNAVPFA